AALDETKALGIAGTLLSLEAKARKPNAEVDAVFNDIDFDDAKSFWVAQMHEASRDTDAMLSDPNLVSNLYDWRNFENERAPRDWATSVAADAERIPDLLRQFLSVGTSQGINDFVARRTERFQRTYFDDLLPYELIASALAKIDLNQLPPDD